MRRNAQAAGLAMISGVVLLLAGVSGAGRVHRFFEVLVTLVGPQPYVIVIAYVFIAIASLGGIAVILGGILFYQDQVRTGHLFILPGTGVGLVTLILFLIGNLRREAFSYLYEVLPVLLAVGIGIAARFWAKPMPIL